MSVPGRPVGSTFWQEQSRRFGELRQEPIRRPERPLGASYHPDGWNLDDLRSFHGTVAQRWLLDHGTPQTIEDFKSIAGVCAVALGALNGDTAWVDWLDCLRRESVDFKPRDTVSTTRVREWRPDPDFEVASKGLLYPPVEIHPGSGAEIVSTELGKVDDVCDASERVCRRLADEALKIELEAPSSSGPPPAVSPTGWTVTQPWESESVPELPVAPPSQLVVHPPSAPEFSTTKARDASRAMTVKEAALSLRVSEDTLQRMRKRGELRMFKVGARWRVLASEVIRLREQPKFANR